MVLCKLIDSEQIHSSAVSFGLQLFLQTADVMPYNKEMKKYTKFMDNSHIFAYFTLRREFPVI